MVVFLQKKKTVLVSVWIAWARVFRITVVGDINWYFDNLSGRRLEAISFLSIGAILEAVIGESFTVANLPYRPCG